METVVKRKRKKKTGLEIGNRNKQRGGRVRFVFDQGIEAFADGDVYGLSYPISGVGFRARIYFDHYNRRLRIDDYEVEDHTAMAEQIEWLADANDAGKIYIKARPEDCDSFIEYGYLLEGKIPGFFNGSTDACMISFFLERERKVSRNQSGANKIIKSLQSVDVGNDGLEPVPDGIVIEPAQIEDIPELIAIYQQTFKTYPSPLTVPEFLLACMEGDVAFRVARQDEKILAVASADMDTGKKNAEMTDCATLPDARGQGLMKHILKELEQDIRKKGIQTAYTLCRATNPGINHVFFDLQYEYTGRMINNCHISGSFEDMNIWAKLLAE